MRALLLPKLIAPHRSREGQRVEALVREQLEAVLPHADEGRDHDRLDEERREAEVGEDGSEVVGRAPTFVLTFSTVGYFGANFKRPVLGCIDADFCK